MENGFSGALLADRCIVVTGGGTGLGRAMAEEFARLGARVGVCGRRPEPLNDTVAAIAAAGGRASAFSVDIRDYEAVGQMIDYFEQELGPVDGLVNNAAGNFLSASEDLTPGGFRAVVEIVLHGTFHCTQQLGRRWIDQGRGGSVVNIVTTYTETGSAFVLPSACAKAGVHALTTTLAYEWAGYGIRVNALAPGPFPTEGAWSRLVPDDRFDELLWGRHPMGRTGHPRELAAAAAFLLSAQASYINGAVLPVDGGERLQGAQFNAFATAMPRPQLKALFRKLRPPRKNG
jgi:NAD(P)-dependent dehydrogenase (short-subunit alcohol dehydrogenase family)